MTSFFCGGSCFCFYGHNLIQDVMVSFICQVGKLFNQTFSVGVSVKVFCSCDSQLQSVDFQ